MSPNALRPEWAAEGLLRMWPTFALVLVLVGALVAMTLIDARTFTIPLVLAWIPAGLAVIVHPIHALVVRARWGGLVRSPHEWTLDTPAGPWIGVVLGAGVGLVAAIALLEAGLLPRSFADFEAWEKEALRKREERAKDRPAEPEPPAADAGELTARLAVGPLLVRTLLFTGPAIALGLLGFSLGLQSGRGPQWMGIGMAVGLLVGLFLRRFAPGDGADEGDPVWTQYPHARREVLKEIVFLLPAVIGGVAGYFVAERLGFGFSAGTPLVPAKPAPLWLLALSGSVGGLLAAGGLVWACRILGTLAFGKEAMGLGDVHLMAAVGAVMGWADAALAFFVAPLIGISAAVGSVVASRFFRREGQALPYGPSLAAATLLVIAFKPLFELGLSMLFGRRIDLP